MSSADFCDHCGKGLSEPGAVHRCERTLRLTDVEVELLQEALEACTADHATSECGLCRTRDSILAKLREPACCDHGFYDRKLCMECGKLRGERPTIHELEKIMDEPNQDVRLQPDGSVRVEPAQTCVRTGTRMCAQHPKEAIDESPAPFNARCPDCERRRPEWAEVREAYNAAAGWSTADALDEDLRALVKAAGEAAVKRYERAKWEKGYASLKDIGGGDDQ